MAMFNPCHPGEMLREDFLKELNVTQKDAAIALGITRKTLSKIVNERGSITPEMAIRLEIVFHKPAAQWLRLQNAYDLNKLEDKKEIIAHEIHALFE